MTAIALPLANKTCIITGGSTGIGFVTARILAERGASVILAARDSARGEAAVAAIRTATGRDAARFIQADLSTTAGVRGFAATIAAEMPAVNVLINNAGAMFGKRSENADGVEKTFALNHLAYYTLSLELLPLLKAAVPARIVIVASEAHRGIALDSRDFQFKRGYDGWKAYKRSKLANILFTSVLARHLEGTGITVNALHPGFVATDIGSANAYLPAIFWRLLTTLFAIGVEDGARTPVHLASAPEVARTTGRYFIKCAQSLPSPAARDMQMAERLWSASEALTGQAFTAP